MTSSPFFQLVRRYIIDKYLSTSQVVKCSLRNKLSKKKLSKTFTSSRDHLPMQETRKQRYYDCFTYKLSCVKKFYGKISIRQRVCTVNCPTAKSPQDKKTVQQNFLTAKCRSDEMSSGKISNGEKSYDAKSCHGGKRNFWAWNK